MKKRARHSGRKRANGLLWLLVFCLAGLAGWLWWTEQQMAPLPSIEPARIQGDQTNFPPAHDSFTGEAIDTPETNPTLEAGNPKILQTNKALATETTFRPAPIAPATNTTPPAISILKTRRPTDLSLRPPQNTLEVQIALARLGISPGSIDGVLGSQTRAAIRAFQQHHSLPVTGEADRATKAALILREPVFTNMTVLDTDLAGMAPVPDTWLAKSRCARLGFESPLEFTAERGFAHPALIRALNPGIHWTNFSAGTSVQIPVVQYPPPSRKAASIRIQLSSRTLQAFDSDGRLLVHFPCSIARSVAKRPVGQLLVAKVAENPNYRFDPAIFPESAEARKISRPLMIPPGPNNPVGTAWIGLNRPGYGIHGTPHPEAVGRTESHGCFRLANWNAEYLLQLVNVGTPVFVEP